MCPSRQGPVGDAQPGDDHWRSLYKIGTVAALLSIVVFGLDAPEVGVHISRLSVTGYLIWYTLISRKLIQLGWSHSWEEGEGI